MIDVIVVAILVFGFLAGILWMCDDLWHKTGRPDYEGHVCVFDEETVECDHGAVKFCRCGKTQLIVRGRIVR